MDSAAPAAQRLLASQWEDQSQMLLASFRSSMRARLITDARQILKIRPRIGVPLKLMTPEIMSLEPENSDTVDQTAPLKQVGVNFTDQWNNALKKRKPLFEYQHLLLLRDIWWSEL